MGNGLPVSGIGMVGSALHKVKYPSPTCEAFISYMLMHGLHVDVDVPIIMEGMGLAEVGWNGIGPYAGRVNRNEMSKGSPYRLVLGRRKNTYRLTAIV